MASVIWKEFPEINRKVAFTFNYETAGMALGCHAGSISGVTATFGNSYYAANGGKNIEVLDTKQEKPLKYKQDAYTRLPIIPKTEYLKVQKHFNEINLQFADIVENAYEPIVERCSSIPLWVLSDVINYEAPARSPKKNTLLRDVGDDEATTIYEARGRTVDFAKYLINNKIGYVLASPIVQNPNHRALQTYSLNQAWLWIPPEHLSRAIDVAEAHGDDQFPSKTAWADKVSVDFGLAAGTNPEELLKRVFNDGIFPKDKRFKRHEAVKEA